MAFVSLAATATGCSVLALDTGFGDTAFGLFGILSVRLAFLALTYDATAAIGCSVVDLGTGFSIGFIGFFMA